MHFTEVQISELMRKHTEKENELRSLMELMLESIMASCAESDKTVSLLYTKKSCIATSR